MTNCIKFSYDYELVKNCRSKSICLKTIFYKNVNKKDGVITMCKICLNN